MQPNTPQRPVMDVATPARTPAPAPYTRPQGVVSAAPMPKVAAEVPVHVAPAGADDGDKPAAAPASPIPKPAAKKSAPVPNGPHTPTALITVTVFFMLVLSVLAVTVYMTS